MAVMMVATSLLMILAIMAILGKEMVLQKGLLLQGGDLKFRLLRDFHNIIKNVKEGMVNLVLLISLWRGHFKVSKT